MTTTNEPRSIVSVRLHPTSSFSAAWLGSLADQIEAA
jgi:hypothetical protein